MIRINLLPFRAARKRENVKRQITIFFLSVALLFVVMAYFFITKNSELSGLKTDRKKIKAELATYKDTIKKINRLEKQIKNLKQKLGVIRTLEKGKKGPVILLDELSRAVPKDRLWLTSMSENTKRVNLAGYAMDNDTVALFMSNLEKSPIISSVTLKTSKLTKMRGRSLNQFSLACAKKQPKKPKKKKPKKRRKK